MTQRPLDKPVLVPSQCRSGLGLGLQNNAEELRWKASAVWLPDLCFHTPNQDVAAQGPFHMVCLLRKDPAVRIFTGCRKNSLNNLWSCSKKNRALPEPFVTTRAEERFRAFCDCHLLELSPFFSSRHSVVVYWWSCWNLEALLFFSATCLTEYNTTLGGLVNTREIKTESVVWS